MARVAKAARMTKGKRLPASLHVGRTKGASDFTACLLIGRAGMPAKVGFTKGTYSCARGKNPREAVAHALKQASENFAKRRGTYRGRR